MTNIIITDIEAAGAAVGNTISGLFSQAKTEIITIEPELLAWLKNTAAMVTPVIKKAVDDAVLAAVTFPGTGEAKAIYAFSVASADLLQQGIPILESQLKALIQIGYNALPDALKGSSAAQAVVSAANAEVDAVGAKIEPVVPVAPATSGSGS